MIYMMTPNYESHKKKKVSKAKKNKRRAALKLLLSFVLVVILMLTAWIQEKSSADRRTEAPALQDLTLLTEWGDKLLQEGSLSGQWSFRWDLLMASNTMEQLADQLFRTEKGVLLPKNIRSNGSVIDGELELPASHLKLVRTEQDKLAEKVTITLLIEAAELEKMSELNHFITKLHHTFLEKDQNLQMSMKVFGKAKNNSAIQTLKQLAIAQNVEEYVDRGTHSVTLFSSRVKQFRWINNEKMANIQVALHDSSDDDGFELTVGIPLISGEFGEITKSYELK